MFIYTYSKCIYIYIIIIIIISIIIIMLYTDIQRDREREREMQLSRFGQTHTSWRFQSLLSMLQVGCRRDPSAAPPLPAAQQLAVRRHGLVAHGRTISCAMLKSNEQRPKGLIKCPCRVCLRVCLRASYILTWSYAITILTYTGVGVWDSLTQRLRTWTTWIAQNVVFLQGVAKGAA